MIADGSKLAFQKLSDGAPGVFHQDLSRNPALDREPVGLPHLLGRQNLHAGTSARHCSSFRNPSGRPITIK